MPIHQDDYVLEHNLIREPHYTVDYSFTVAVPFDRDGYINGMTIRGDQRTSKLKRYRNLFGVIAALLLLVLVAAPFAGIPAQPIIAIFLSVFGTFVVFVMKVADAT